MTHRPERFEVYTQLPDGTGFTIKDCDHVFTYDRHGGWYDEEDNYYNANGEPASSPEDRSSSHEEHHDGRDANHADEDDFFDDIARQYDYEDRNDDYAESEEEYSDEEIKNLQCIDRNKQQLSQYAANKPLRVFYENIESNLTEEKIRQLYSKIALLAVVQSVVHGKDHGRGHFILPGKAEALKLVLEQGRAKISRPVYYKVEPLLELLADPIPQHQLRATKSPTVVPQEKLPELEKLTITTQKPKASEQKIEQPQAPKPADQPKPANDFQQYSFPLTLFKSPDDFKLWMKELGMQFDRDYTELKKVKNSNGTFGWLKLRRELHQKVNLKQYNGQPIELKPIH